MKAFVYIVECADHSFYTGWTYDLQDRMAAHNAKTGAKYTRTRTPVKLVYWEEWPDRQQAQQRELKIKKLPRAQKEQLVGSMLDHVNI